MASMVVYFSIYHNTFGAKKVKTTPYVVGGVVLDEIQYNNKKLELNDKVKNKWKTTTNKQKVVSEVIDMAIIEGEIRGSMELHNCNGDDQAKAFLDCLINFISQ